MTQSKEIEITEQVKSLYEIMQEEKVEELNIKSPQLKLHIRRKNNLKNAQQIVQSLKNENVFIDQTSADSQPVRAAGDTIQSPITGVFYRSPSPASPTFVKEGDVVDAGKTLCIIEAMKVMNEIKATEKVRIVNILAENGKPINSGQDLFAVEKL